MIRYKMDVLAQLKARGYSSYVITKRKLLNNHSLQQIRDGQIVSWNLTNKICEMIGCQPGDIYEYVDDNDQQAPAPYESKLPPPTDQANAQKIRQVAEKKGLTMKELAIKLGKQPQNFSKQLIRDNFTVEQLVQIAQILGCTFDTAFYDKETGLRM